MKTQISTWNIQLFDGKGRLVATEKTRNTLHVEGEKYILSAAFATSIAGYGPAPSKLYAGLDVRTKIHIKDTLSDCAIREPKTESYKRLAISTENGFSVVFEKPKEPVDMYGEEVERVFTLQGSFEFKAAEDYGTINNCFLTTAAEGTQGTLIISTPLEHPFEMWEGYRLVVKPTICLRAALLN